jgi:hypothetical protein
MRKPPSCARAEFADCVKSSVKLTFAGAMMGLSAFVHPPRHEAINIPAAPAPTKAMNSFLSIEASINYLMMTLRRTIEREPSRLRLGRYSWILLINKDFGRIELELWGKDYQNI